MSSNSVSDKEFAETMHILNTMGRCTLEAFENTRSELEELEIEMKAQLEGRRLLTELFYNDPSGRMAQLNANPSTSYDFLPLKHIDDLFGMMGHGSPPLLARSTLPAGSPLLARSTEVVEVVTSSTCHQVFGCKVSQKAWNLMPILEPTFISNCSTVSFLLTLHLSYLFKQLDVPNA
jgi:hypothetical protein